MTAQFPTNTAILKSGQIIFSITTPRDVRHGWGGVCMHVGTSARRHFRALELVKQGWRVILEVTTMFPMQKYSEGKNLQFKPQSNIKT